MNDIHTWSVLAHQKEEELASLESSHVQYLEEKTESLSNEVKAGREHCSQLEHRTREADDKIRRLQDELRESKMKCTDLQAEVERSNETVRKLKQQNDLLEQQKEELSLSVIALKDESGRREELRRTEWKQFSRQLEKSDAHMMERCESATRRKVQQVEEVFERKEKKYKAKIQELKRRLESLKSHGPMLETSSSQLRDGHLQSESMMLSSTEAAYREKVRNHYYNELHLRQQEETAKEGRYLHMIKKLERELENVQVDMKSVSEDAKMRPVLEEKIHILSRAVERKNDDIARKEKMLRSALQTLGDLRKECDGSLSILEGYDANLRATGMPFTTTKRFETHQPGEYRLNTDLGTDHAFLERESGNRTLRRSDFNDSYHGAHSWRERADKEGLRAASMIDRAAREDWLHSTFRL